MFVLAKGSFNAMEPDLRAAKRLDRLLGERKPSVDRIGDVSALMDPEPIRRMLSEIVHRVKRMKALHNQWPLAFAALDGHEFFSLKTHQLAWL